MQTVIRLALLTSLLISLDQHTFGQKKKRERQYQPVASQVMLLKNGKLSDSFFMHYFVPNKTAIAYTNEGQKLTLSQTDTFFSISIDTGTINGISGNWVRDKKNINLSYYIYFDSNLTDVTEIKRTAMRREYYSQVNNRLLLIGGLILPFLFIGLYVWRVAPEKVLFPWKK